MTLREFLENLGLWAANFLNKLDAFATTVLTEPFLNWPLWYFLWVGLICVIGFYFIIWVFVVSYGAGSRLWARVPDMPTPVARVFAKADYPVWTGWKGAIASAAWAAGIFWAMTFVVIIIPLLIGYSDLPITENIIVAATLAAFFGAIAFSVLLLTNLVLYLRQ